MPNTKFLEKKAHSSDKNEPKDRWDKSIKVEESHYYHHGPPIVYEGSGNQTNAPKVAELFCGCGGTSIGFAQAGFEVLLGADIHSPSVLTFKNIHPKASAILGDLRKIDPSQIIDLIPHQEIDILIAGVPCQGFSLNNRKRHIEDERNKLYKEFTKMIEALSPKCILLENVSGMRSSSNLVAKIKEDLSNAGGYSVTAQMLNAAYFGVPQNRQRLIFVGTKGRQFNFDSLDKHKTQDPPTVRDAIGDLPSIKPGAGSFSYKTKAQNKYQELMRLLSHETVLHNHRAPNHPPETIAKIAATLPGEPIYERYKQRIRLHWDRQSPTQVSGGIRPQFQFGHPHDPRGLSIRERCRIQSIPDHIIIEGGIVQGRVQTGNAVPPLLAKAIAEELKRYL